MRLDPLSGFSLSIIKFSKTDQILSGIYEVDERPKRAVVKTYPFFIMVRIVVIYIFYVSSLHETQKRQQRTSLLERGGKPPYIQWQGCSASGPLLGGDQRFTMRVVA
jgi:hypothetical protein